LVQARESSQANSNRASGGEDVLPISGGHADAGECDA
jgi:hypothetical protein